MGAAGYLMGVSFAGSAWSSEFGANRRFLFHSWSLELLDWPWVNKDYLREGIAIRNFIYVVIFTPLLTIRLSCETHTSKSLIILPISNASTF